MTTPAVAVYDYIGAYRLNQENLQAYLEELFERPAYPITVQIGADNNTYTVCVPRALKQFQNDGALSPLSRADIFTAQGSRAFPGRAGGIDGDCAAIDQATFSLLSLPELNDYSYIQRCFQACQEASNYPSNGIRTRLPPYTRQSIKNRLAQKRVNLFQPDPEYHVIDILEACDGSSSSQLYFKDTNGLQDHLWQNRKDPRSRHVFIQADSSILPLDCSEEMLLQLLSFHHVMPRFLDMIFSFGKQPVQRQKFHYTAFHREDFLDSGAAKEFEIPSLGRSGRQIRHCYNLWSAELSHTGAKWSFRQTAVYHSFDVDNGRAFWINVKANDLMLQRITELEEATEAQKSGIATDSQSVFASTLTNHLVMFEWCSENWQAFVSELEAELGKLLDAAKNAPLVEIEKKLAVDPVALLSSQSMPVNGNLSRQSTGIQLTSKLTRLLSGLDVAPDNAKPATAGQRAEAAIAQLLTPSEVGMFNEFSVDKMQRLTAIGSQLREAASVMKMNAEVLEAVTAYYTELMENDEFPLGSNKQCRHATADFKAQTQCYLRTLASEQTHIATLLEILDDGKVLFETMLQFRNVEISKLFAVKAHDSAERVESSAARVELMTKEMHASTQRMEKLTGDMGRIAEKTERETASMHIITLVTLVFLPGTFVATLFGSGLYQWDDDHPEMAFPMWKQEYFNLFAKICFPMMFGVILIWFLCYVLARQRRRKIPDVEEAQVGTGAQEKQPSA